MSGRLQATDEMVRRVVERVVSQVRGASAPVVPAKTNTLARSGAEGVFATADEAISAASAGQKAYALRGLSDRRAAIEVIRTICREQAEPLGREEFEETKIGRLEHKIDKLRVVASRIPGVEWLSTRAFSGEDGIALEEYGPFGVIAAVTPVTHSLPTLACNAINMLAGGNTVVFNAHPSGARIAAKGVRLFNHAIRQATGLENLLTIVENPTIESAQAMFDHRDVKLVCVTGGPALARAALRSPKRAVVAGPGNPPVVVDGTADLDNAARSIVAGATYDNNLLCIAEKEVFVVAEVFDELFSLLPNHKSVLLNSAQVDRLTAIAFKTGDGGKLVVNKDLVGADATTLARHAGLEVPADTLMLHAETSEDHPFVGHEQMMPFVPFVRCRNVDQAIELALKHEHGYGHTSIIHSRNVETITRMGKVMNTTLFVQNGACMAGLGAGGEGYVSFSIATPTGEGVTTPATFCRTRRSTTVRALRVV